MNCQRCGTELNTRPDGTPRYHCVITCSTEKGRGVRWITLKCCVPCWEKEYRPARQEVQAARVMAALTCAAAVLAFLTLGVTL